MAEQEVPFGGAGDRGTSSYHGKRSIDIFSHEKRMVNKSTLIDIPPRYMPHTSLKAKLIRYIPR